MNSKVIIDGGIRSEQVASFGLETSDDTLHLVSTSKINIDSQIDKNTYVDALKIMLSARDLLDPEDLAKYIINVLKKAAESGIALNSINKTLNSLDPLTAKKFHLLHSGLKNEDLIYQLDVFKSQGMGELTDVSLHSGHLLFTINGKKTNSPNGQQKEDSIIDTEKKSYALVKEIEEHRIQILRKQNQLVGIITSQLLAPIQDDESLSRRLKIITEILDGIKVKDSLIQEVANNLSKTEYKGNLDLFLEAVKKISNPLIKKEMMIIQSVFPKLF